MHEISSLPDKLKKTRCTKRVQVYAHDGDKSLKSNSPEGPSEIEKMWHKVGKTDPLISRPEITYSMLRIVV